jgi:hypothetical protein
VPSNMGAANAKFVSARGHRLTILLPVYNDWEVAGLLLRRIDSVCAHNGLTPSVLLVNDGSTQPFPDDFLVWSPLALRRVEVLDLYKNLGHQRAICVGMVHVSEEFPDAALLVMDADGEDAPEQIPALIQTYLEHGEQKAVFAARRRRMEGFVFKAFYQLYRLLHILLVGSDIRVGNFSVVPPTLVPRLVRSSELWNHYAACAIKSKLPMTTLPLDRARRFKGRSKMGMVGWVVHGLSAMSVYSDIIGVRVLAITGVVLGMGVLALISVVVIRLSTSWVIPGWATNLFALTLVLMFQVVIVCLLFTFGVLASRGGQTFMPVRDCPHFVLKVSLLEFKGQDHSAMHLAMARPNFR